MSKIEWTNETWSPVIGCTKCSPGCANCYAQRIVHRFEMNIKTPQYLGKTDDDGNWTGQIECCDWMVNYPLKWKKPRKIFVCSMSDLFHPEVPFCFFDKVFSTMVKCSQHTFQVLTKRPKRMAEFIRNYDTHNAVNWPKKNIWLGVSVSTQTEADEKIPILLQIPAAIRFVSIEPMLEEIDIGARLAGLFSDTPNNIDWVIVGGESGPKARPMHPDWARSIRDQCQSAGVPFFFKQWGKYLPSGQEDRNGNLQATDCDYLPVGKKKAGCLLDGKLYQEYPKE